MDENILNQSKQKLYGNFVESNSQKVNPKKFKHVCSVKSQIWAEPKYGQLQFKPIYQNRIPKIT
jgi:hypothetical protein